jgi:hypothetical protein
MRPSNAMSLLAFLAALVAEIVFGRPPGEEPAMPQR